MPLAVLLAAAEERHEEANALSASTKTTFA